MLPHETIPFRPFSHGPRKFLGRFLGWAEMRLILVNLIWQFDISNMSSEQKWEDQQVLVMWEMQPMMVKLGLVNL